MGYLFYLRNSFVLWAIREKIHIFSSYQRSWYFKTLKNRTLKPTINSVDCFFDHLPQTVQMSPNAHLLPKSCDCVLYFGRRLLFSGPCWLFLSGHCWSTLSTPPAAAVRQFPPPVTTYRCQWACWVVFWFVWLFLIVKSVFSFEFVLPQAICQIINHPWTKSLTTVSIPIVQLSK